MPRLAIAIGIVLIIAGVAAYVGTGMASVTALIPSFLGALIAAFGALGLREDRRRASAGGVAALALLGLLGTMRGVGDVAALVGGAEVGRPVAAVVQGLTALLCLVLLVASVRTFRAAGAGGTSDED